MRIVDRRPLGNRLPPGPNKIPASSGQQCQTKKFGFFPPCPTSPDAVIPGLFAEPDRRLCSMCHAY
jgi:hypothetical protein